MTAAWTSIAINVFLAVRAAERPARRAALSLALPLHRLPRCVVFVAADPLSAGHRRRQPETRADPAADAGSARKLGRHVDRRTSRSSPAFAADLKAAPRKTAPPRCLASGSTTRSPACAVASSPPRVWRRAGQRLLQGHVPRTRNPVWGEPEIWVVIKRNGAAVTPYYLLTAVDLTRGCGRLHRRGRGRPGDLPRRAWRAPFRRRGW